MLLHLYVDFNTMMMDIDEPRRVQLAAATTRDPAIRPLLRVGARVVLFDEELIVEAVLAYDTFPTGEYWLALPDWTTLQYME